MPKGKVYCKDCGYKRWYGYYCKNPNVIRKEKRENRQNYKRIYKVEPVFYATDPDSNKGLSLIKDPVCECIDHNEDGMCKYYKKKWYKF